MNILPPNPMKAYLWIAVVSLLVAAALITLGPRFACGRFDFYCPKDNEDTPEIVQGPKECDPPAIPMSTCKSTCSTECKKSGYRIWIEGGTVIKVEECGICKLTPIHIDACPAELYIDKARCEKEKECKCAEKAKSTDGNPCYSCKYL